MTLFARLFALASLPLLLSTAACSASQPVPPADAAVARERLADATPPGEACGGGAYDDLFARFDARARDVSGGMGTTRPGR